MGDPASHRDQRRRRRRSAGGCPPLGENHPRPAPARAVRHPRRRSISRRQSLGRVRGGRHGARTGPRALGGIAPAGEPAPDFGGDGGAPRRTKLHAGDAGRSAPRFRRPDVFRARQREERGAGVGREAQRVECGRGEPRPARSTPRHPRERPGQGRFPHRRGPGQGPRGKAAQPHLSVVGDSRDPVRVAGRVRAPGQTDCDRDGIDPVRDADRALDVLLPQDLGEFHHHQRAGRELRYDRRQQHSGAGIDPPALGRAGARQRARALAARQARGGVSRHPRRHRAKSPAPLLPRHSLPSSCS